MEQTEHWRDKKYSFFSNRECEYFPCHRAADPLDFNCLFCYCPLYALGRKCGGSFRINERGYKDCTDCLIPHRRDNYGYITGKYREIMREILEREHAESTLEQKTAQEDKKMKKPVLVVMAAGMGSRYGGLKQIDPVDREGHIIMDFSIFDAVKAGFEKVIFIIKRANEADFRTAIGDRLSAFIEVSYVFQDIENIPAPYCVPEGRVKPWGTGHAVLSCIDEIDGPFAVINADDYYGSNAFRMAYDYLSVSHDTEKYPFMMVGYQLSNTLTENGHVSRGVCETDENGFLQTIHERTRIEKRGEGAAYTEDAGETWVELPADSIVSMNMWGFTREMLGELKDRFVTFLAANLAGNPQKCEYFLPFVVDELLREGKAEVKVLKSMDKWYGVTYKEDKPVVVAAIAGLKEKGLYPFPERW